MLNLYSIRPRRVYCLYRAGQRDFRDAVRSQISNRVWQCGISRLVGEACWNSRSHGMPSPLSVSVLSPVELSQPILWYYLAPTTSAAIHTRLHLFAPIASMHVPHVLGSPHSAVQVSGSLDESARIKQAALSRGYVILLSQINRYTLPLPHGNNIF